jgi:hypothetical protein
MPATSPRPDSEGSSTTPTKPLETTSFGVIAITAPSALPGDVGATAPSTKASRASAAREPALRTIERFVLMRTFGSCHARCQLVVVVLNRRPAYVLTKRTHVAPNKVAPCDQQPGETLSDWDAERQYDRLGRPQSVDLALCHYLPRPPLRISGS